MIPATPRLRPGLGARLGLLAAALLMAPSLAAGQDARPTEAAARYRAGFQMLQARDMRNAAIEFEQAVKADSTYGDAYYALGKAYIALEEYDKAVAAYEAARRHGVSSDRAQQTLDAQLADIHYKAATKARSLRRYRDAIAAFEKSLALKPGNALAYYGIGLSYGSLREPDAAQRAFEQAIALDAGNVQALVALGDLHRQRREFRQAADHYSRAAAADPAFMPAHTGLARAQMESGDLEGAVATLERALKADANSAYARLLLGTALIQLGRHAEAVPPLRRSAEMDASVAEAHFRLGEALYGKGDYRAAIEAAGEAVRREPNYHAAEVVLADAHAKLGQVTEARSWYQKARTDSRFRDYCDHRLAELAGGAPAAR